MQRWYYHFETDSGHWQTGEFFAKSLSEARDKLEAEYPDDIGADGVLTDADEGDHYPWNS